MNQILHKRLTGLALLATFLAVLVLVLVLGIQQPASQERGEVLRIEEQENRELQPLTAGEKQQAITVLQSDTSAQRSLAEGQRVRTIFIERYGEDKDTPTGQRRAHVVLYNYDTNETTSAVVTVGSNPRVEYQTVTRGQPLGLSAEEVEEAKQLALAHPTVRARLQAAGLAGRENELSITHRHAQATSPDDPCSSHRCVALHFNTRDAVLDIEPIVDLTTGEVEIQ